MKKSLLWLTITIMCVALISTFALAGCKTEAEEIAEEVEEEAEEVEEETTEEVEEEAEEEAVEMEPVTITMTTWHAEENFVNLWNALISVFNETYPDITVEYDPASFEVYDDVTFSNLELGTAHDIVYLRPFDLGRQVYEAGFLHELTVDEMPNLANFPEANTGPFSSNGVIYGSPDRGYSQGVYYNKDMFNEYDLEVPETWDEFIDVLDALKNNGKIPSSLGGGTGAYLDQIYYNTVGVNLWKGEEGKAKVISGEMRFTDDPFVKAFEAFEELMPYFNEDFVGADAFAAFDYFEFGEAGTIIDGTWNNGRRLENSDFEVGYFTVPPQNAGDEIYNVFINGGALGINKNSENIEAALVFLNWLATIEAYQARMDVGFADIPILAADYDTENDLLAEVVTVVGESTISACVHRDRLGAQDPSAATLMREALLNLLSGDFTAEEAAKHIDDGLAKWYEPYQ